MHAAAALAAAGNPYSSVLVDAAAVLTLPCHSKFQHLRNKAPTVTAPLCHVTYAPSCNSCRAAGVTTVAAALLPCQLMLLQLALHLWRSLLLLLPHLFVPLELCDKCYILGQGVTPPLLRGWTPPTTPWWYSTAQHNAADEH
jgi:hypothetical protein